MTNSWVCVSCGFETSERVSFPLVCPNCKTIYSAKGYVFDLSAKNNDNEDKLARALLRQERLDKQAKQASSDPRRAGRAAWRKLHSYQGCDMEFLIQWEEMIPPGCSCKASYESYKKLHPPNFSSPLAFFNWGIVVHNLVNAKLKKPVISLDRARMLWRHERPNTGRTRAIITVANGSKFVEILKLTRPYMQAYADRCNADLIDLDNDTEDWGPMEKFRVWHFAKEYDEVLFVDADIVIKPEALNIFEMCSEDICIHDDWGRFRATDWLDRERKSVAEKTGLDIQNTSQCLNSGVVLSRKAACDIWLRPCVDIGTTQCAEQIWIEHQITNAVCSGATLGKLDPRWNWQWWFTEKNGKSFDLGLEASHFVHFATCPSKLQFISKYLAIPGLIKKKQLKIDLTAVTSLSLLPNHLSVQERCLKTWLDMGLRIVSGNAEEDIPMLAKNYPHVEFVPCEHLTYFGRKLPLIRKLMDLSEGSILLINSDIEMHGDQKLLLQIADKRECGIGIRYNYSSSLLQSKQEKWGLDAFLLHPEVIKSFPQLDFAIGNAMWDYWVAFHLELENAKLHTISEPFFFHKSHPINWDDESLKRGERILKDFYKVDINWAEWRATRDW